MQGTSQSSTCQQLPIRRAWVHGADPRVQPPGPPLAGATSRPTLPGADAARSDDVHRAGGCGRCMIKSYHSPNGHTHTQASRLVCIILVHPKVRSTPTARNCAEKMMYSRSCGGNPSSINFGHSRETCLDFSVANLACPYLVLRSATWLCLVPRAIRTPCPFHALSSLVSRSVVPPSDLVRLGFSQ